MCAFVYVYSVLYFKWKWNYMRMYATVSSNDVNLGIDLSYSMERFLDWSILFKDVNSYIVYAESIGKDHCDLYGSVRFLNTPGFENNIMFPLGQWVDVYDNWDKYKSDLVDEFDESNLWDSIHHLENDVIKFIDIPTEDVLTCIRLNILVKVYCLYNKFEPLINVKEFSNDWIEEVLGFFGGREYIGDIVVYLTVK